MRWICALLVAMSLPACAQHPPEFCGDIPQAAAEYNAGHLSREQLRLRIESVYVASGIYDPAYTDRHMNGIAFDASEQDQLYASRMLEVLCR